MAIVFEISSWNEQTWWNTKGTRDKKIFLNPNDGDLYYFKKSYKKGIKDYKHEFWSEIIASEVGKLLEFNILEYHVAINGETIGCISKSMNQENEELIDGGKYLQAFDSTFNPEDVKLRKKYNFDLIINALIYFEKEQHLNGIIENIVFDALIGNSDRHQENWAIINVHSKISKGISQIEKHLKTGDVNFLPRLLKNVINWVYAEDGKLKKEFKEALLVLPKETRFAPIFDSGCSFGRELDDAKIMALLNSSEDFEKYINKGLTDIRWGDEKINHFRFVENLLQNVKYNPLILKTLTKIIKNYDHLVIEKIVIGIDKDLQILQNNNILPIERKQFIVKLLNLRFIKLEALYNKFK